MAISYHPSLAFNATMDTAVSCDKVKVPAFFELSILSMMLIGGQSKNCIELPDGKSNILRS